MRPRGGRVERVDMCYRAAWMHVKRARSVMGITVVDRARQMHDGHQERGAVAPAPDGHLV